jgi:hypothetical protein
MFKNTFTPKPAAGHQVARPCCKKPRRAAMQRKRVLLMQQWLFVEPAKARAGLTAHCCCMSHLTLCGAMSHGASKGTSRIQEPCHDLRCSNTSLGHMQSLSIRMILQDCPIVLGRTLVRQGCAAGLDTSTAGRCQERPLGWAMLVVAWEAVRDK